MQLAARTRSEQTAQITSSSCSQMCTYLLTWWAFFSRVSMVSRLDLYSFTSSSQSLRVPWTCLIRVNDSCSPRWTHQTRKFSLKSWILSGFSIVRYLFWSLLAETFWESGSCITTEWEAATEHTTAATSRELPDSQCGSDASSPQIAATGRRSIWLSRNLETGVHEGHWCPAIADLVLVFRRYKLSTLISHRFELLSREAHVSSVYIHRTEPRITIV